MKNNLTTLAQQCIYCNFLIDDLIKYNSPPSKALFTNIKNENLRNIRILCYLYEYLYKDVLTPENVNNIDLSKNSDENLTLLFKLFFQIISNLKILKFKLNNPFCNQFINKLIYSYFSFTSCINYIFPTQVFVENKSPKLNFSKIRDDLNSISNYTDFLREICIDSIEFFFDYPLRSKSNIENESYEVFFQNDPNNKFHQYFFDCSDRSIKVRISVKDSSVFYMYQVLKDSIEISPSMTNEDSKIYSDSFLKEKFEDEFDSLLFDKDYLNIYSYMNIPESYKYKYNFKDNIGKINLNKGIYITIDARYIYIQELCLF